MSKAIDVKSMLIGFLLATSVMLFMGATSDNGNGSYQMTSGGGWDLKMIDTRTGELYWFRDKVWKRYMKYQNWIVE